MNATAQRPFADLILAGGICEARMPTCIANSDYLNRFELLALHSADQRCVLFVLSAKTNAEVVAKLNSTWGVCL